MWAQSVWAQSGRALRPQPVTHANADEKAEHGLHPEVAKAGASGSGARTSCHGTSLSCRAPRRWTFRSRQVSWLTGHRARSAFPDVHPVTKSNGTLRSQLRGQLRLGDHHVRRPNSHLSLRCSRIERTSNTRYGRRTPKSVNLYGFDPASSSGITVTGRWSRSTATITNTPVALLLRAPVSRSSDHSSTSMRIEALPIKSICAFR